MKVKTESQAEPLTNRIKDSEEVESLDYIWREDGQFVVACAFDGETFKSRTLSEALQKEGVHKASKYVTEDYIPHASDLEKDETLLEDWKRNQGTDGASGHAQSQEKNELSLEEGEHVEELPEDKSFNTIYTVLKKRDGFEVEKFKKEKIRGES